MWLLELSTVAATSRVGTYTITAGGAADPDYVISYNTGVLTINPAKLTITADSKAMTYRGKMPALTATYTGLVDGDTPATFASSPNTAPKLSTTVVAASQPGPYVIMVGGGADPNYAITFVNGTLTITPAPLTITAVSKTMTYGGALPVLTVTYTGLVSGDTPATFASRPNTAPKLSTVSAKSHVGKYAITVSGASDPDYTITYVSGTLTITPARLTIRAVSETMTFGSVLPALTVTYTGLVNGDSAATLAAHGNTAPKLSTVPGTSAIGTYVITVDDAYDPDYLITYVYGTLTIIPPRRGRAFG